MKTAIKIGGDMMKEACPEIANAIERIFESGHHNHMDQGTIQCALYVLLKCSEVSNINIDNAYITDKSTGEPTNG